MAAPSVDAALLSSRRGFYISKDHRTDAWHSQSATDQFLVLLPCRVVIET